MKNIKIRVDGKLFASSLFPYLEGASPKHLISIAEACLSDKSPAKPFKLLGKISLGADNTGVFSGDFGSLRQSQFSRLISNCPSELRAQIAKKAITRALGRGAKILTRSEPTILDNHVISIPFSISQETIDSIFQGGISPSNALLLKRHLLRFFETKMARVSKTSFRAVLEVNQEGTVIIGPFNIAATLIQSAVGGMDFTGLKKLDAKLTEAVFSGESTANPM